MVSLVSLWLPILLGAVLVFIVSSIIHMVFKYHQTDYRSVPDEDAVRAALRPLNIPPGDYVVPKPADAKDMGSPEYQKKVTERTAANLTHLRLATAEGLCAPLNVEGGWYAVLRLPPGVDEETLVLDLLAKDDVLVQPGYFYDFPFPCLVLSLLTPDRVFQEGVGRLMGRTGL